jgi:triacylglycerol lipase
MSTFLTVIYSLLFSVLTNCYIYIGPNFLLLCTFAFVFLFLIFYPKAFSVSKEKRLCILCQGTTQLIAFCFSLIVSVIFQSLLLFGFIKTVRSIAVSIVFCVITNLILFFSGIIRVYLTSVQLGIKIRVIGAICCLIPIANLFALNLIIRKTYNEVDYECEKEQLNESRAAEKICKTKYPILFVHGVFFRDSERRNYWGRIPKELELNGATCFYGNHQSASSIEESAKEIADRINQIVEKTGCKKINIIAHSKGGLDCRYAIANCGIADKVASLTTINTPHRGCVFAGWLLEKASEKLKNMIAVSYNTAAKFFGDSNPDFLAAVENLTSDYCAEFNKNIKTPAYIYCQSVGSVMHKARSGKFPLNISHNFVKSFDGDNDGLVGVDSFEWGEKYTLIDLPLRRGISHADMIDLTRENLDGFDVREFYVKLVEDLKKKGF